VIILYDPAPFFGANTGLEQFIVADDAADLSGPPHVIRKASNARERIKTACVLWRDPSMQAAVAVIIGRQLVTGAVRTIERLSKHWRGIA
jgi:hypothetical protein